MGPHPSRRRPGVAALVALVSAAAGASPTPPPSAGGGLRREGRQGRAEPLDRRGGLGDDWSREALLPSGAGGWEGWDDIGDPEHLVPGVTGRRGDIDGEGSDDDGSDDGGLSVQSALPSFEDVPPLTSLLARPPLARSSSSRGVPRAVPPGPLVRDVAPAQSAPLLSRRTGLPPFRKTGTTVVGVLCDSGRTVVIGADTRATDGTVVADKRCEKVHRLADNVWCCGAGTSGDIDALVRRVRYTFLLRGTVAESVGNAPLEEDGDEDEDEDEDEAGEGAGAGAWGAEPRVDGEQGRLRLPPASVSAVCRYVRDRLYGAGGSIGANLVLGGYDPALGRAVLTAIHPHGSVDVVPYTALGSGGLAATAVLESRFPSGDGRNHLSVEEAVGLVRDAVGAGVKHDLGSGSQVDLCVIGPRGTTYRRAVVPEEELPSSGAEEAQGGEEGGSDDDDDAAVMNGVNGFGSLPYFVESRRVVMEGEEAIREGRRRQMEALLELEDREEMEESYER